MSLLRIICKPFKLKELPKKYLLNIYYKEVIGMGFHPERVKNNRSALFSELPRLSLDLQSDDNNSKDISNYLKTGERGDGKIFTFPVENFIEF